MALDPLTAGFELGKAILDRVIPDKAAREQAQAALVAMQAKGELAQLQGQLEINKVEAASSNWFVAGWRPAVGWTCVLGLLSQFVIRPFATWIAALLGHAIAYPSLDMGTLLTLLLGMLGLATQRTYEKIKNAAGNH